MRIRGTFATLLILPTALILPGCLNLGGKTTYVQENPETIVRISSLESRVAELETMLQPTIPEVLPH